MELICPLCNGFITYKKSCPFCGNSLRDGGTLQDFYGPYSPYDDFDNYPLVFEMKGKEDYNCIHLVYCPICGFDTRIVIEKTHI